MITLTKGQNAPLPGGQITVTVDCAAPADLSALLVTASGKVRTDADFIFFNQPDGPGVRCVGPIGLDSGSGSGSGAGSGSGSGSGSGWKIVIDPSRVPADIDQIRTVLTLAEKGKRFGQFGSPVAHLLDAAGNGVAEFELVGLQSESIVIALEVYRRAAAWKVRAVGQGYAGGFAALVMDHGVSVDDDGEDAAVPPPVLPVTQPVPDLPAPRTPPQVPGYPPAPPPAAPPAVPAAPVPAAPLPTTSAAPVSPTPAPAPRPSPNPPGEISLRKGARIDLKKGERVSLRKEDGGLLTRVRMGLGWDPLQGRGSIDLDASAVLYAGTTQVDIVAYTHLRSNDGSVTHSGDNLTGDGAGDDEVISIDLTRIPPQVTTLAFVVTSFLGQTFAKVSSAFCRLVDDTNGAELVRFTLDGGTPTTAMVMATLHRSTDGAWKLQAIGQGIKARLPGKAAKLAVPFLPRS